MLKSLNSTILKEIWKYQSVNIIKISDYFWHFRKSDFHYNLPANFYHVIPYWPERNMTKFDLEGETGLYFPFFLMFPILGEASCHVYSVSLYFNFRSYVLTFHRKPCPGLWWGRAELFSFYSSLLLRIYLSKEKSHPASHNWVLVCINSFIIFLSKLSIWIEKMNFVYHAPSIT